MIKRIDAAAVQLVTRENIRALAGGKTQPLTCDCCGEPFGPDEEVVFYLPPCNEAATTLGGTKCDVCGYVNKHYEPGDYCDGCGSALSTLNLAGPEFMIPYPTETGSKAQLRRILRREPSLEETAAYHAGRVEYHERYLDSMGQQISPTDALWSWLAQHPVISAALAIVAWAGIGFIAARF